MAGYLERVSRPGVAVCVLLTLLVVGCLGPGESELLEISDPAAIPPAAGSDPTVTVAAVAPVEASASSTTSVSTPSAVMWKLSRNGRHAELVEVPA